VLAFTPFVESALHWFDATHDVAQVGKRWMYRLVRLPGPGGLSEQSAQLMAALDLLRHVHNDVMTHTTAEQSEGSDG
jgi:hypothetical protein